MSFLERLIVINQEYLRVFIISALGQAIGIFLLCTMLERRRSLGKLVAFTAVKLFFSLNVAFIMFGSVIPENEFTAMLRLVGTGCLNYGMLLVLVYSFKGSFVKVAIAVTISEIMISCIMLPSVMVANILSGRGDMFTFYGELHAADIMIPVVEILLLTVVYRIAAPLLKRYRDYRLFREKVWLSIWSIYFISIQFMSVADLKTGSSLMVLMYCVYLGLALLLLLILNLMYWRYQYSLDLESEYLNTQLKLMELHYESIGNQNSQIEQNQQLIDAEMRKIRIRYEKNLFAEEYMDKMKEVYSSLNMGGYCSDVLIDAVLYGQVKAAEKCGMQMDYQLQGYQRGELEEKNLARILLLLFQIGMYDNNKDAEKKSICLKMNTVHNQLAVSFEMKDVGKRIQPTEYRRMIKRLKAGVQQIKGSLEEKLEKNRVDIRILLPLKETK